MLGVGGHWPKSGGWGGGIQPPTHQTFEGGVACPNIPRPTFQGKII